jgi:Ran GTPase-activating protein (RanGAP) involved in mRNA processing and transport
MRSIVEGLKLTSALECLVLKGNSSIGETGAEILADAIRLHPALAYLDLEDCGLRDRGARAIFAASAISRSLQHLNMSDNGISDDSLFHYAESIERVDFRLVSLKLNANFITSKSFVSFCQACARAKARQALCLQRLEIQGNKVSDDGMASLDFLLDSPSLAFLQLGANQISGSGILMAVPSLSINSSLKALHLNGNCIGSEGAFALCGALKGNSSLEVLGLGGSLIGDVGAVAVADLLGSRGNSIAHLNLWDNNISSIGAKALARSFEISTSISFVDLWNNRIGDDGAKAVALAVVRNPMIIDLSMNYPSEKFSQGVSQVLSRNREIQRRLKKVCFLIAAKRLCFGWSMFDKHIVRAIWEFSDIK